LARAADRDRPRQRPGGLQAAVVAQAARLHARDLGAARAGAAVDRGAAQVDAVAEIAGAVAAFGVGAAQRAGGACRVLGNAARGEQAVVSRGRPGDLARQTDAAVDLALARITGL